MVGTAGTPTESTARGAVYFGGLDGLRFVAAYAVLVHHVEQTLEMNGYARRILRIWPLYYAIAFVGLWLGPRLPALAWPGAYAAIDTSSPTVVLLYLVILPNAVWRFFGVLPHAAQLWSIGIEEQFYLVW